MNICPRCGRELADGEICNCTAQNPQNIPYPQQSAPGQVNLQKDSDQPVSPQYGQPAPPQYPQGYNFNPQQQEQPKKKGLPTGCIIALVIGVVITLLITAVLAAILVPAMIGYTKKSNLAKSNVKAKTIYNAAQTALVELDEEGELEALGRNFIICSEEGSDFNVEGDSSDLHSRVEQYLAGDEDGKEWDYFFVVEDYQCVYAAASRTDLDFTGTYPMASSSSFAPKRFDGTEAPEDWTISDLYTHAVTNLPIFDYDDDDDDWGYDNDWGYDDDWDDWSWDESWYFDEE